MIFLGGRRSSSVGGKIQWQTYLIVEELSDHISKGEFHVFIEDDVFPACLLHFLVELGARIPARTIEEIDVLGAVRIHCSANGKEEGIGGFGVRQDCLVAVWREEEELVIVVSKDNPVENEIEAFPAVLVTDEGE